MDNSPNRCTATAKSTGERCKSNAMVGQKVCYHHGGNAPQCKKSAIERLQDAVDPLTEKKIQIAQDAWQMYQEAKEAGNQKEMDRWLDKFNKIYEEIADRAGPPKVRKEKRDERVEHSGSLQVSDSDKEKVEDYAELLRGRDSIQN